MNVVCSSFVPLDAIHQMDFDRRKEAKEKWMTQQFFIIILKARIK